MSIFKEVTLPRDERGNDPNDFRDDPDYLEKLKLGYTPVKTLWKPRQIDSEKPRNSRLVQGVQAAILDIKTLTGRFDYVGHRTTTSSRLVLEFEHHRYRYYCGHVFQCTNRKQKER